MAKKIEVTQERGSKSLFVRDVLTKNPHASVNDVNHAWTAAGNPGTLGDTTIYKIKSEIGKSSIPVKRLPLDSPGTPSTKIELKPDPRRKTANADIRDLVVEELRLRIKSASINELIDLMNGLGVSPNTRSVDPAVNGST
jgi:hypothetical protein